MDIQVERRGRGQASYEEERRTQGLAGSSQVVTTGSKTEEPGGFLKFSAMARTSVEFLL